MIGLKDFKHISDIDYYFVNLSDTKFTRKELLGKLSVFKEFMEKFNCSVDKLDKILKTLDIPDHSLFEYAPYTIFDDTLLVSKDDVYREIVEQQRDGHQKRKAVFYNIYITSNPYVSLSLGKVAKYLVAKNFPFLNNEPFSSYKRKFSDKINTIPTSVKAHISDLRLSRHPDDLTIEDVINLYTKKDYKNAIVKKPNYDVFANGSMYITIDESKAGHSLSFSYKDLLNKDWDAIENKHVFSICLYDDENNRIEGKWFEGEQKDAPYFNSDIVKEFKRCLLQS